MIALRYVELLSSRQFVANLATGGFFYAGTFAYIDFYRINPRWYGLLFGMGILGMMVMNQVNARLLNRLGSDTLMAIGGMLAALSGGILAMATWSGRGGLPLLIGGCFLYVSSTGLVLANALVGVLNCTDGTPWPMGAVIASSGLACAVSATYARRHAIAVLTRQSAEQLSAAKAIEY